MKRILLKLFFVLIVALVFADGYQDMASADCHQPRCAQTCNLHVSSCGSHMTVSVQTISPVSLISRHESLEKPLAISLVIVSSVFHPPKLLA
jgi:hypothetical protein